MTGVMVHHNADCLLQPASFAHVSSGCHSVLPLLVTTACDHCRTPLLKQRRHQPRAQQAHTRAGSQAGSPAKDSTASACHPLLLHLAVAPQRLAAELQQLEQLVTGQRAQLQAPARRHAPGG